MSFQPKTKDFELSPYTGLTRESWIEAGRYMLEGIFKHIKNFEDPVVVPRIEEEITYPHKNSPKQAYEAEVRAEIFEGLTRTLFIAAPLIHDDPEVTAGGYRLRDYYKNQILRSCTCGDSICVGTYEDLQKMTNYENPYRAFQQTVETCALVICLEICHEEIWDIYTKEEQDTIAAFLSSFAHANTVPQNWRLFNMLDLAFLNKHGYKIDENIMFDHAQAILNFYVGDGWYRDGHSFDYYSCWAFNVYAPIWNEWYGYEHEPYLAQKFEEHSNELMKTYADFFDEDGFTNMWGRSGIYRFAAVSAFDGNLFLKNSCVDPGLARRISSGSLMQFLGRDDTFVDGVPTLGFYRQFSPLVQGYSCAESPFWMGKAFLCLHLPKDHPFWTAKEHNGTWEKLSGGTEGKRDETGGAGDKPELSAGEELKPCGGRKGCSVGKVKETTLDGPALCFTNHKSNHSTILRTGKVLRQVDDVHGMWNYAKLSFHTKYPWEAAPNATETNDEIESMQYVLNDLGVNEIMRANAVLWCGERGGVLYRRQYFNFNLGTQEHWTPAVNLADFPVEYGIFRVDKHKLFRRPVVFTLGSYGFPDNGTEIRELENTAKTAKAVILKGTDSQGRKKQLAMTVYTGFTKIGYVKSKGSNPDSENSIIIYACAPFERQYDSSEPYLMISQVITKEDHEDFAYEDIFPVKRITNSDTNHTGAYGVTKIEMVNGKRYEICFEGMEGNMRL